MSHISLYKLNSFDFIYISYLNVTTNIAKIGEYIIIDWIKIICNKDNKLIKIKNKYYITELKMLQNI